MVRDDSERILNTEMKDLDPEQTTPEVQVAPVRRAGSSNGEASRGVMLPEPPAVFKALSMTLIHHCREANTVHFAGEKMIKLRESRRLVQLR